MTRTLARKASSVAPHVANGTVLDLPEVEQQRVVILCGEIAVHRKLLKDNVAKASSLALFRCGEDRDGIAAVVRQLNSSLLVARQSFIEQLPEGTVLQLAGVGKGCKVLALLELGRFLLSALGIQLRHNV